MDLHVTELDHTISETQHYSQSGTHPCTRSVCPETDSLR